MKTKVTVFKKAISVMCILSMLLSLCIVSFAGGAYAAETKSYTFSQNGVTGTPQNLEVGSTLAPGADLPNGVKFVGWYDKTFTTKYTVAGAETNLYAKYSSTVLDYENGKQLFYPHEGETGYLATKFETKVDPTDSGNHVLAFKNLNGDGDHFAFAAAPDVNEGYKLSPNTKYEVNFDYYFENADGTANVGIKMQFFSAADTGIGKSGNKTNIQSTSMPAASSNGWQNKSFVFTTGAASVIDAQPYLILFIGPAVNGDRDVAIYIDNVVITPVTTMNYTLNNKGVVTNKTNTIGTALPEAQGAHVMGWYDKTLTTKFDKVTAASNAYYAKYDAIDVDFSNGGYFDPNIKIGTITSFDITQDPKDSANKVILADMATRGKRLNFAFEGAPDTDAGLTLKAGKVYCISFNYYVENATDSGVALELRLANADVVGTDGAMSENFFNNVKVANTNGKWVKYTGQFTIPETITGHKYLTFFAEDLGATGSVGTAKAYFDNFAISPYVPFSDSELVMDFENNFQWSVPEANVFDKGSGNQYVSRGEIVDDGTSNMVFKMMNYRAKLGHTYFTLNDGTAQFSMVSNGLYTISFDYKILHSETPVELGITYVNPTDTTSGQHIAETPIKVFENINLRDDTEPREDKDIKWQHVTYSFCARSAAGDKSSLAIYLKNQASPPEEYATVVLFDNIKLTTHSLTGKDSLVYFDAKGGTVSNNALVVETGKKAQSLPVPVKEGYDFVGWKYEVAVGTGINTYDLTTNTVINDAVINAYAVYKLKPGVIELKFRTNVPDYDKEAPTIIAYPGKPVANMPANPEHSSQKFVGWYMDRNLTKAFNVNSAPSESTTLYAKWESEGIVVDFENYPSSTKASGTSISGSDRYRLQTLEDGNTVLRYDIATSTSHDANALARMGLHDNTKQVRAFEGNTYTVKVRYKVLSSKFGGVFGMFLSKHDNYWTGATEQANCTFGYGAGATDDWVEDEMSFVALVSPLEDPNNNYVYIAVSGDSVVLIDKVTIIGPENDMNTYGSFIRLYLQDGRKPVVVTGDPGDKIVLPNLNKVGYLPVKWYTDKEGKNEFTDTVYKDNDGISLYAQWQVGMYTESFEKLDRNILMLGFHAAYSQYDSTDIGFDASNIRTGDASIFRDGSATGEKMFTLMRNNYFNLTVGETYEVSFYVKPTAVTDSEGVIQVLQTPSFTALKKAENPQTVAKIGELNENEWNLVKCTITAQSPCLVISTSAGNDMYFDDITVRLQGYTGDGADTGKEIEIGAPTGDSSISPILVLAMIIVSAGAMIIAGKKVFAK